MFDIIKQRKEKGAKKMYRTIIELKDNTPLETAKEIRQLCIGAYNNFVGKVQIKDLSPKSFAFEGEEKDYNCLQYGSLRLDEQPDFKRWVKTWLWEDEDPDESCDLIKEFSEPIYS